MALFEYLATDSSNQQVKGSLEAVDLLEAKTKLKQSGLFIVSVRKKGIFGSDFELGGVRGQDLTVFIHQFAVMISSGIPLIRSLKAVLEETTSKALKTVIEKVVFDVENGASLSVAFSKHPKVFSNFFVSLVKSGEASGTLPNVLKRIANHLEKEGEIKRKVASGFAYPAVVGVLAVGVVIFMLIFIVPVFSKVYQSMRMALPGPTVALIAMSNLFTKFWWIILLLSGFLYYIFTINKQNYALKTAVDKFKLKIPIFGQINSKVLVSRFIRTLSTMLGSGLTLSAALLISKDVVGNSVAEGVIESVHKDISQGKNLSDSLKIQSFFPSTVVQMISAGEESGQLSSMMDKCADFLDEGIDTVIKSLVVKLEPTLTFFLAALVGFIALAIYLPMFDLIKHVSG